jgi:superoxide reductase
MHEPRFFHCPICGAITVVNDPDTQPFICCGEPLIELTANSTDASQEKHVPVLSRDGEALTVKVGAVAHPMEDTHFIQLIYLQTAFGAQQHFFVPGDKPEAKFSVPFGKPVAVYEFCNLHGLWKTIA